MNITPTEITAYTITLTESEIRASFENPRPLLEMMAAAIHGAKFVGNGNGLEKNTPRKPKRRKHKDVNKLRAAAASIGKPARRYRCKQCGAGPFNTRTELFDHKREEHRNP